VCVAAGELALGVAVGYPDASKVELFRCPVRKGWSAWGNEVEAA
jgi:hypothetical protein